MALSTHPTSRFAIVALCTLLLISATSTKAQSNGTTNSTGGGGYPFPEFCNQNQTIITISSVAAIIISIVMIFFGYKVIKPITFCVGFGIGFSVAFMLVNQYIAPNWIFWGKFGVSCGAGLILGALLIFLTKTAVFAMGFAVGVLIASFVLATPLGPSLFSTKDYLPLISVGLAGIAGGAISFLLQKYVIMFACAFLGGAAIAFTVDCAWLKSNFIMLIPNIITMRKIEINGISTPYILLGGVGVLTVIGFIFQLYYKHRSKHPKKEGYELVNRA